MSGVANSTLTNARAGKKAISGYFDPAWSRMMNTVALERNQSLQAAMKDAFALFLFRIGKKPPDANVSEDLLLFSTRANNPWMRGVDTQRDGLLSWRDTAARMLIECDYRAVMYHLVSVLDELAGLTGRVVLERYDETDEITFDGWLSVWRENFDHWHDPVRALIVEHATKGEGPRFAETLIRSDGLVLLDWLLANLECWIEDEARAARAEPPEWQRQMLDRPRAARPIEWYARCAYEAFRDSTEQVTVEPRETIAIPLNYDRLYPAA